MSAGTGIGLAGELSPLFVHVSRGDFIGECRTTLRRLLHRDDVDLPLVNEQFADKKPQSGFLHIDAARVQTPLHFLDFILGGTQLDVSLAVDFSAPSSHVASYDCPHCLADQRPQQFEVAMKAILHVLQDYNRTQSFDVYGFGGVVNERRPRLFPLVCSPLLHHFLFRPSTRRREFEAWTRQSPRTVELWPAFSWEAP